MNKKSSNAIVLAVSVLAVCFVAVAAVLVIKFSNSKIDVQSELPENNAVNDGNAVTDMIEHVASTTGEALGDLTGIYVPSSEIESSTSQQTQPSATQAPTAAPTDEPQTVLPTLNEEEMEHGQTDENDVINSTPTTEGELPSDMSIAGLWRQGYDVIGLKPYIFNDDKDPNCMQANFGYNWVYDLGANLIDFHIETCKLPFEYNGKQYRIQLWKGQYISGEIGTVGGEIGLYTREPGKFYTKDHYDCAPQDEWVYMEMTCLWDDDGDGVYSSQFTRNYDLFWWATGFVDGQLADLNDTSPVRILGRITFKDVEQAKAFEQALANKGFSSVSTFRPDVPDTYKRYGKDVIFIWQDAR